MGKNKKTARTPLRKMAKLWDKWGDHLRKDSYDPNSPLPSGNRKRIKFERMLGNFVEGGKFEDPKAEVKKAKGGLIKSRKKSSRTKSPRKKSIDGIARRGKTRGKHR